VYSHLNLEEREKLFAYQSSGKSLRWIAKRLCRSQSSLTRELQRNRKYGNEYFGNPYIPCKAQRLADKRAADQRWKAPLKNPEVFLYVRECLRKRWSPEIIAGRIRRDIPGLSICPETIYQYIFNKRLTRGMHLEQYLTLRRKKRMKKLGRSVRRLGRIPEAVSIEKRPKSIVTRKQIGHWETDNVIGTAKDKTALSVTVERKTRYTIITKLRDRTATVKADAVISQLQLFPSTARRSLTADNGLENVQHKRMTQETGMPVYFCHAYHSWEKPTVENTNGRIRRYIPKGMSIDQISVEEIKRVETSINTRPMKCLRFLTPYEMMCKLRIISPE
jgi:transposase, IS30 family